jgi:glycosyltransferase involved in cell wall biosynthesis
MNVLFLAAYPPVLHRHGGGVRMYHNIRILSEQHSVHVLSFVGSDEEEDSLGSVKSICESVRGIRRIPDFRPHWLSVTPFMVREFSTPAMHQAVDDMLRAKRVNVVQCEYLQMAQFRRRGVFSLLTAHEVLSKNASEAFETESDPLEKLRLFYRWMQILRYEVLQVRKFNRIVTMTSEDAAYLRSYAPEANIRPIPIGVDVDQFTPGPDVPRELSVVFVGNFFHTPNVEASSFLAREVAPRFPDVKFRIAGIPVPDGIPPTKNVELTGYVPDTRSLYHAANTIVVAPLFSGSGQRVKLLEAFSMACPVVTTTIGAQGFPIENGIQAFIADTADEFAGALRRLLADPALRRRTGENARAMILNRFTWTRIGKEILDVVAEASVSR